MGEAVIKGIRSSQHTFSSEVTSKLNELISDQEREMTELENQREKLKKKETELEKEINDEESILDNLYTKILLQQGLFGTAITCTCHNIINKTRCCCPTKVVYFRCCKPPCSAMLSAGSNANPLDMFSQVRTETSSKNVGGMHKTVGILTNKGGMTSHAVVVVRGWGKCCVSGCIDICVNADLKGLPDIGANASSGAPGNLGFLFNSSQRRVRTETSSKNVGDLKQGLFGTAVTCTCHNIINQTRCCCPTKVVYSRCCKPPCSAMLSARSNANPLDMFSQLMLLLVLQGTSVFSFTVHNADLKEREMTELESQRKKLKKKETELEKEIKDEESILDNMYTKILLQQRLFGTAITCTCHNIINKTRFCCPTKVVYSRCCKLPCSAMLSAGSNANPLDMFS
ncbi:hypothetical protein CTI12_AA567390 [Artemisia annua]|uniref:PEP-utilising enzyme mobile domain-containing protein n=1 Tax=Artemisia annua TaxID=35608 RepID=A0A2U1KSU0_ARTAN|nr:hypothetical protein CTI12_AA567390 [Artemisia annua]